MSELRYYKLFYRTSALTSPEFISVVEFGNGDEVYLKSEVDRVITTKDSIIADMNAELVRRSEKIVKLQSKLTLASLAEECSYLRHRRCNYCSELQRQKYKRCLAMAKWCKDKVDAIKNGYIRSSIESQNGIMTTCPPECNPKFSFYSKWHKRWLELAEKFKEAK